MNFIDSALQQGLRGDDFLQAMAEIYSHPEVRGLLHRYPPFVADVVAVIDYDTALAMDGLEDVIHGNLAPRLPQILAALQNCGASEEAAVLSRASAMPQAQYEKAHDQLYSRLAMNNDYEGFWNLERGYIDRSLAAIS